MTVDEKANPVLVMPIDPEKLNESAVNHEQNEAAVVNKRWIKAEAFIAIWDLARLIAEGTHFQKKSRIVLEYDPQVERFSVVTITEPCSQKTDEFHGAPTVFQDGDEIVFGRLGRNETFRIKENELKCLLAGLNQTALSSEQNQISGTVLDLTDEAIQMQQIEVPDPSFGDMP